jgi:UbiD family decarboxylase
MSLLYIKRGSSLGKYNWKEMREFLEFLEQKGEIIHIKEEVDPEWEVNGITRMVLQKQGPAIIFHNVKGADLPLATGILGSDKRYLWALGLDGWTGFNEEWSKRTEHHIPPRMVDTGVCQEETKDNGEIDFNRISMSVSITRDPDTGVQNVGIYRMATLDKDRLSWGAAPYSHGRQHYIKYEDLGEPMPIAIVTGCNPSVLIAAATRTQPGVDEVHLAGALMGEPVEMVKCKSIDIEVPAWSEMVFEGLIHPGIREMDKNFGEVTGYYGEPHPQPVFELKLVTHRKDPMFVGSREQWYPSESCLINGRSSQAEAYSILKKIVPGILDMRTDVTYEAIIKIKKLFKGHPQQVMDAVWGATYARYKHVIVVDEDIDIWDYNSVHWALSTRVDAGRDVCLLPRRAGQHRDPSVPTRMRGWQTGMGIDATLPTEEYDFYGEKPPVTIDDPEIMERVKEKWGKRLRF